ncbi:MAG: hypothetical protein AB7I27_02925 [Bacteriovoracaceae bacterium]
MNQKIKAHFLKIGPLRFVIGTVITLSVLDLINTYYLKLYWAKKKMALIFIEQSILHGRLSFHDFSDNTIREMTGFINNTFYFFLLIIVLNNFFFYFFYLRKKLWAQSYVHFYALTAAVLAILCLFDNPNMGIGWDIYNIVTFLIYLYLYFGVKLLKDETTLGHEKKEQ